MGPHFDFIPSPLDRFLCFWMHLKAGVAAHSTGTFQETFGTLGAAGTTAYSTRVVCQCHQKINENRTNNDPSIQEHHAKNDPDIQEHRTKHVPNSQENRTNNTLKNPESFTKSGPEINEIARKCMNQI